MDDDQQFCLKWNNHQSTLIQNFDTLLESGTLVDCTLAAEGKYLKAHRVVLSACSPYFEGLLSEHYDMHPVFILKDVKFKELKAMIDYMYRGEVNISQDQLTALLKAAESLQIKGLSESKTVGSNGNNKSLSRVSKVAPQPRSSPLNISYASAGLTIERNRVPRQASSIGDLPEDSHSPQIPKEHSSREGSLSPTSKKRRKLRRRSAGEDTSIENHEASNSSDIPQQMGVPALAIAPVADEKTNADPTDSLGRSALMTQLTKPADEMLQMPLENPEPSDNLIEPKSEYMEDQEESVEDLTLDDDMNDLNEIEQDTNRAGPSHDTSQHPETCGVTGTGTGTKTGTETVAGGGSGGVGISIGVFESGSGGCGDSIGGDSDLFTSFKTASQQLCYLNRYYRSIVRYPCMNCSSVYNKRGSLMTHLRYECGQPPRFKCPYCDMISKKTSNVQQHIRRKHKGFVVYVQDTHYLRYHLNNHHYNHHNRLHHLIKEETKNDKRNFVTTLTDSSIKFVCPMCGRSYNRRANLRQHIKYECGQQPRFKCPYCKYRSKKTSNVYTHIRSIHSDIIQLGDFNMVTKKQETTSSKNHHHHHRHQQQQQQQTSSSSKSKKRFSCPRCGSTFNRKNNLGTHMKYECGQLPRFGCPYCQYCSKKSSNIRAHVPRKHFGLSYQVYPTNLPNRTTNLSESESSLLPNTEMINGDLTKSKSWDKILLRKFPCSNCKSVFSRKGGLTYHQKFECGQLPRFICPYCNYRAKHVSNARRHIRTCHPGRDVYTVDICQLQQSQQHHHHHHHHHRHRH
ncbi:hypothetical protein M0804_007722 [Polistes exclamans]|nr:hypothetical protein M0804_007722 [Polistes exclamans]